MSILLTGGLGFIGSHIAVEIIQKGYNVIIIDNLSNSSITVLDNIAKITNSDNYSFYHGNINDKSILKQIFTNHSINTVIHLAAYKAVGESVQDPLKYYHNNITGLIILLDVMNKFKVKNFVFSSSATVYGNPAKLPLTEKSPLGPINPYGQTKLMSEQILQDVSKAHKMKVIILRYFNPVGAHESGLIGERSNGVPNNLFPYILEVINSKRECLSIYGNDYNTPDGTGIRDYIHVVDLAQGHVNALKHLDNIDGVKIYNLGTGKGFSVLNIVDMFNNVLDKRGDSRRVKYVFADRREGDAPIVYADCSLAEKELDWKTTKGLEEMVTNSLNFLNKQLNN